MRYSRQREALANLLHSVDTHPDAEEIYTVLRKEFPNISLGTVYRNLRQLVELGDILEIHCGEYSRFDGEVKEHHHMYCKSCGRLYDVPKDRVNLTVGDIDGFDIRDCTLLINGICKDCVKD